MHHESISQNGARDRPENRDQERIRLSKDRRIADRVRGKGGVEETAFRQADRSDVFSGREDRFAAGSEKTASGGRNQRTHIRREYARAVRDDLGVEEMFNTEHGSFIPGAGSAGSGNRWRSGKVHSGSASAASKAAGYADAGLHGAGEVLDAGILQDEESDPVLKKTARAAYGSARLASDAARKTTELFQSGEKNRIGRDFSTERGASPGRRSAIWLKQTAFYAREEGIAAESAAQQQAKELQRHLIRKQYQTAPEGVLYIPVLSRIRERRRYRKEQAALQSSTAIARKAAEFFETHPMTLIVILLVFIMVILFSAAVSGGTMLLTHTLAPSTLGTTFTAEDEDINGADADYRAMEAELAGKIGNLEAEYPGYASYELNAAEIGHDPYKLAAILTILHDNYKREDVQETLKEIFELQYNLSTRDEAGVPERKTVRVGQSLGNVVTSGYCNCPICCGQWSGGPTASGAMPTSNHTIAVDRNNPIVPMGTKIVMNGIEYTVEDTGNFARYGVAFDVYYDSHSAAQQHGHRTWEAYIADDNGTQEVEVLVSPGSQQFTAVLKNNGLDYVADQLLSEDQIDWYKLLVETKGNKPDLFADDIYANPGGGLTNFSIAGEALSDQKFANMIAEAQKYLGMPYVWGGSSPATSFDCSGFVCWVINHSGNGWNVGRTTANGLCNMLPKVPLSEAKPGDILFFQGTYATAGASHVGIYVGNNTMIHCGSPIQYARIDTPYYRQHFYCVGRLS